MITESSIEVDAPTSVVWDVFADVEHWPAWTSSVTSLTGLDAPTLAVGHRFEIKQPRFPKLVWQVTDLEVGRSWTWRQRSVGSTTLASHELEPLDGGRTLVRQRIDQRGPLGAVAARLMSRLTRRYLDLEAHGLKAQCEQRVRGASDA